MNPVSFAVQVLVPLPEKRLEIFGFQGFFLPLRPFFGVSVLKSGLCHFSATFFYSFAVEGISFWK
jgi:hypothetical protein